MSNSLLKVAGDLIKGDLADVNSELKAARERRGGVLWRVLTNLICYANNEVFEGGYTKKLAKQFKLDLVAETGLSEKQAAKYTESISAGLGVRGVRKGMRAIDGLPAAAFDGVKSVQEFLTAAEILTFNNFVTAVKVAPTPVQRAAKVLEKLTPKQREDAMALAAKADEALEQNESEE